MTSVRTQAHALVLGMYRHGSIRNRETILSIRWSLWPVVPQYGRRAVQFTDLLGYFTLMTSRYFADLFDKFDVNSFSDAAGGGQHGRCVARSKPNADCAPERGFVRLAVCSSGAGRILSGEPTVLGL